MKVREVFGKVQWSSRGKPMRHRLTGGILLLVLVVQFGCAGGGTGRLFPLPREAFQRLGTVAVTTGRFAPEFNIVNGPTKGAVWGASKGALEGFFAPLQLGAAGTPLVLPIIAVLMPVGLVAGAIEGAKAEPAVKVEEREATAREMVASQRIQDDLRDRVAAVGRAETPHTLTVLADRGPIAVGEQPDYRPLSQEGIQTVLEVVVESVNLMGGYGLPAEVNPKLGLVMIVKRRLVRTVDNLEIHAKGPTWYYGKSGQKTLEEWVGNQEGFHNELNQVYAHIAKEVVGEVLLRGQD